MNPIIKNILAVIAGLIVGGFVNMGIILVSGSVIPPPDGVDVTTTEGMKAGIHLFEAKHFLFPFLAHALGTFFGAIVTFKIAATHKMKFALSIGGFFLLGGIVAATMIPAPTWFIIVDLLFAYIPMVWLAGNLLKK